MFGSTVKPALRTIADGALRPSAAVVWLSWLIAGLALVAAGAGLFWPVGRGPASFTTVRGEVAQLFGQGLYRYDSVFIGAGNKGTDLVVLVLGIPLLVLFSLLYRRASVRGGLLLVGTLVVFLYVYASYALSIAYNELFILYVVLFAASFYAFVLAFTSFDVPALAAHFAPGLPRRGAAVFMIGSGLVTAVIWLAPLVVALVQGQAPERLDGYTTKVTEALDSALIAPAAVLSGVLILRRAALGYLIACSLLILEALLLPLMVMQTVNQVAAGVSFLPGQLVGVLGGFGVLAALAVWVLVSLLRHVTDAAPAPSANLPAGTAVQHYRPAS